MQRILLALCDRFVCVQDVGPMSESDVTGELGRGPKLFLLVNRTREGWGQSQQQAFWLSLCRDGEASVADSQAFVSLLSNT